jgi:predicted nucleic acid-binding protein
MSKRRIVDTNIIVRYLVQDDEKHSRAATQLVEACDRGELTLVLLPAVVAECVFVLESFYQHPRADIAHVLSALVASPGIQLLETAVHLDALDRYRRSKLHFVDCVISATAARDDIPVATFDRDFKKFGDVRVEIE